MKCTVSDERRKYINRGDNQEKKESGKDLYKKGKRDIQLESKIKGRKGMKYTRN